jgi:ankyrin repeat protein
MKLAIVLPAATLAICLLCVSEGCGQATKSAWHQKYGWKAEEYFDDAKVVELCKAIEADEAEKVDRLIAAGADVSAKGKGNMTPLLWAFPGNKPAIFKRLLEAGADPNVIVESDFNTRHTGILPGYSVTLMAAKSSFRDHFIYVMEHEGDPNLVNPKTKDTVLTIVIVEGAPYTKERIQLLIDKGVDLNQIGPAGCPPVIRAG